MVTAKIFISATTLNNKIAVLIGNTGALDRNSAYSHIEEAYIPIQLHDSDRERHQMKFT